MVFEGYSRHELELSSLPYFHGGCNFQGERENVLLQPPFALPKWAALQKGSNTRTRVFTCATVSC